MRQPPLALNLIGMGPLRKAWSPDLKVSSDTSRGFLAKEREGPPVPSGAVLRA